MSSLIHNRDVFQKAFVKFYAALKIHGASARNAAWAAYAAALRASDIYRAVYAAVIASGVPEKDAAVIASDVSEKDAAWTAHVAADAAADAAASQFSDVYLKIYCDLYLIIKTSDVSAEDAASAVHDAVLKFSQVFLDAYCAVYGAVKANGVSAENTAKAASAAARHVSIAYFQVYVAIKTPDMSAADAASAANVAARQVNDVYLDAYRKIYASVMTLNISEENADRAARAARIAARQIRSVYSAFCVALRATGTSAKGTAYVTRAVHRITGTYRDLCTGLRDVTKTNRASTNEAVDEYGTVFHDLSFAVMSASWAAVKANGASSKSVGKAVRAAADLFVSNFRV